MPVDVDLESIFGILGGPALWDSRRLLDLK